MSKVLSMFKVTTVLALAVVTGAACGGGGGSDDGGRSYVPPPAPVEQGGGGGGGGGEAPPKPPRVISVAGVRLDNTSPDFSCTMVRNTHAGIRVQIVGVSFQHEGNQLVREDTHCPLNKGDDIMPTRSCESGTTLPVSTTFTDGCRIGSAPKIEGAPYNGKPALVTLSLQATCTDPDPAPCDQIDPANPPSASSPVTVTWTTAPVRLTLNPT